MVFFSFISALFASGSDIVVGFAGIGGLAGLAAMVAVVVTWLKNRQEAKIDVKSVAITEIEKAVPGLGDIIREWQAIVHQLQADLTATRSDLEDCRHEVSELRKDSL